MEILETIKTLLGSDVDEALAAFAMELARESICSYCNMETVPPGLRSTWAAMAVDCYRQGQYGGNLEGQEKSIARGDTSLGFVTPAEQMQMAVSAPSFAQNYQARLAAYRRLR